MCIYIELIYIYTLKYGRTGPYYNLFNVCSSIKGYWKLWEADHSHTL